jgi:hypothetical protein
MRQQSHSGVALPIARRSGFVDAEHFQPISVFFGSVSDEVSAFNISLRPIALSEIDQVCALGAKDIHPKA